MKNDPCQLPSLFSSANLCVCYSATRKNKNSMGKRKALGHEVFQHQENVVLHFQLLPRIFLTAFKTKKKKKEDFANPDTVKKIENRD